MKFSSRPLLTCAALLFAVSLLLAIPNPSLALDKPGSKITAVEVQGAHLIKDQTVIDASLSQVGEDVNPAKIELDLKAIYNLGFFSDVKNQLVPYQGGTKIVFIVKENPQITDVIFTGNSAIPTQELLSIVKTRIGQVLSFQNIQSDIGTLNDYYQQKGYSFAKVVDVSNDPVTGVVTYKILEGEIEAVNFVGNDSTQDYVIRREINTKPGTVFNRLELEKDLRRVFNLGFFSEVTPDIQPGSAPGKVIMILNIKETRTNTFNFGGGFGEKEGWFGFIDASMNNLLGTGQGIMVRGQSGSQMSTYQFRYTNPWFWPDKLGARTSLSLRRWYTIGQDIYQNNQNEVTNGWSVSIGKTYKDYYNTTYTLGSERVDPYGGSSFEAYLSDTIGVSFAYDTRDVWMNPSKGVLYNLAFKEGLKHADSGNTGFFKTSLDGNVFYPLTKEERSPQVLALHMGLGMGFGDVPFSELFWAGGPNTIRGYGPSDYRTGNRRFIGNIEYRLTFSDTFQGVFFFDYGDAWNAGFIETQRFISGWGPGVRMNTPLGPIRLDYGVASGKTFGEGIIHFSIGQAF